MAKKSNPKRKSVESLKHKEATRKNIPTAEYQSVMQKEEQSPIRVAYERRNRDLDPQLVWRGKDEQDWSDLVVQAPPLYIQEKVHPKVLIDDLLRRSAADKKTAEDQFDLFADFNGLPSDSAKTEFYQHDANWSNRMILGDSLQVMASLAEREGLRGKVQCIYIDPPYGIKFNSNFQWSTTSRDVKDGNTDHITREPEQVKAFRDTWRDGIHSYLTYLRDRLTVTRELLSDSGSIFVQIGDENVHRVRALMDEVFGNYNFISLITTKKSGGMGQQYIDNISDYILWYGRNRTDTKYRPHFQTKILSEGSGARYRSVQVDPGTIRPLTRKEALGEEKLAEGERVFLAGPMTSETASASTLFSFELNGEILKPRKGGWKTGEVGMARLVKAERLLKTREFVNYKIFFDDFPAVAIPNLWEDTMGTAEQNKVYVVQTTTKVIQRCILMTTDPGDLVLDPTCGSGTTAYVAEQWGRRWITIDTSRVALALARARIMGARYPYYILADSRDGQLKEAEITGTVPSEAPTHGNIRQGFVYERVPHITLKSIANNAEIDVIWEDYQKKLEPLREQLNKVLSEKWSVISKGKAAFKPLEEWEIPRDLPENWPPATQPLHTKWWEQRIARQKEIDASIAVKAEFEYLYDKPYEDNKKVRVAGPFTVESLSPHRVLGVDENDELIDHVSDAKGGYGEEWNFTQVILENLKTAGVQQAHKEDKINFISIAPWPGHYVCAEGRYRVASPQPSAKSGGDSVERRAGIFVGPEFGTVSRPDLVEAAREAGDADFDTLIACAFNYDAHSSELSKLGRIPILKARMNADLHMADDLKNTGKGNLFVIFGEPDIEVVSGLWLVDSKGRMVADYDHVKELSGLGSLEEINRLGGEDLFSFKKLAGRGEVRVDQPIATGGSVGAGQHRGRSSKVGDGGISTISERGERLSGGSGDAPDSMREDANVAGPKNTGAFGAGSGDQSHARWAKTIAALEALAPADFPLQLTTNHFTQVTLHGIDVFHPNTGEVRSDNADGIACWFIDTDYNGESFFVRHAYFLGANDPYKSLKTTLKAEVNEEAWATLNSDTSRPFDKPQSGRIAVKVINHLGDEVMKVFRVK
jgi:adenine-specific DNA-methyltransferase